LALPTLEYNSSTGSDTAASGAGPATAVTGTTAAHTGGSPSTTITLTNTPDLSGVASDGSAAIFLATSSGSRHLSKITGVDDGADTVTVEDSFNIAAGSAVNYAIGGKRLSLIADTSRPDWDDTAAGWTFALDGTFDINSTSGTMDPAAGTLALGPTVIKKSTSASGRPVLRVQDANAISLFTVSSGGWYRFDGVKFLHEYNWAGGRLINAGASEVFDIVDCVFSSYASALFFNGSCYFDAKACHISQPSASAEGVYATTRSTGVLDGCVIKGCTDGILMGNDTGLAGITVLQCLIYDCSDDGIVHACAGSGVVNSVINCTIVDNGGDGISVTGTTNASNSLISRNNVIAYNGAYGELGVSSGRVFSDYNAYYSNTSGEVSNVTKGANSVTLSADPFTARGSDDYTLNATAGGGAACREAGFPGAFPDGT